MENDSSAFINVEQWVNYFSVSSPKSQSQDTVISTEASTRDLPKSDTAVRAKLTEGEISVSVRDRDRDLVRVRVRDLVRVKVRVRVRVRVRVSLS